MAGKDFIPQSTSMVTSLTRSAIDISHKASRTLVKYGMDIQLKSHIPFILLASILILSLTACSPSWTNAAHRIEKRDSPRVQDLKTLYTKLPTVHKNFFHEHDEETFTETYDHALPVDRKSTRLNSSHVRISYAVFCLK